MTHIERHTSLETRALSTSVPLRRCSMIVKKRVRETWKRVRKEACYIPKETYPETYLLCVYVFMYVRVYVGRYVDR
jgi:hypothetical protein